MNRTTEILIGTFSEVIALKLQWKPVMVLE